MSEPIEAEIVPPTQALAVRQQGGAIYQPTIADMEQAFAMAKRQRELLHEYITSKLQAGKHFYQREGDSKPSLNKEGAEIILLPHGLAPDYELIDGPSGVPTEDAYQITVKCILRKKGQPNSFEGSALGSAGSQKWTKGSQNKPPGYVQRQKDKYLCHNATLKMAQKSALIAVTLNSTAASEFFTQDMDPRDAGSAPGDPGRENRGNRSRRGDRTAARPNAAPGHPQGKVVPYATKDSLGRFLRKFENLKRAAEFFAALGWLLPDSETAEDLHLKHVPVSGRQAEAAMAEFKKFENGEPVKPPYPPNPVAPASKKEEPNSKKEEPASKEAPAGPDLAKGEAWRNIICPIPHKGERRDDYMKNPETVGWLYDHREEEDVGKRLFGFIAHFEVSKTWTTREGEVRDRSYDQIQQDELFREALDACADYHDKHGSDTEAP